MPDQAEQLRGQFDLPGAVDALPRPTDDPVLGVHGHARPHALEVPGPEGVQHLAGDHHELPRVVVHGRGRPAGCLQDLPDHLPGPQGPA